MISVRNLHVLQTHVKTEVPVHLTSTIQLKTLITALVLLDIVVEIAKAQNVRQIHVYTGKL